MLRVQVWISLLLGLGLYAQLLGDSSSAPLAPQSISVTDPSGLAAFGELNEYATLSWNDPWDMSQPLDVRQLDSPQCSGVPNHFTEVSPCPDGIWCGLATTDNPDLFVLFPGHDALHTGRDGHIHPINASVYRQLTFRMYVEAVEPGEPGLQIYWTNGTLGDIGGNPNQYGGSHFYKVYAGWHIYTIDLGLETDPLNGDLPWTGSITGLRFDPALLGMTNRQVQLDWVRLTPRATRPVAWSTTESGNVSVSLQPSGGVPDRLHIYALGAGTDNEVTIPASAGDYDVPASLPPGDWFVHLSLASGSASGPAGPWRVRAAPTLSFVAPSYTTGEDFAWAKLGENWDMNELSDIFQTGNLAGPPSFAGGELTGTSADTDPNNDCSPYWEDPYVNLLDDVYWGPQQPDPTDPPIDTNQYRYLSFRLRLDGTPDVSFGWVARIIWADLLFANCGVTDDIPLHAGWNVVHLDLWQAGLLEPDDPSCQSNWRDQPQRRQLRLDPLEVPVPTTFHLDWIKLAAMDTGASGGTFAVKYLRNAVSASVAFYYDTDRNPNNGRTLMDEYIPSNTPPAGPWSLFLPGIFRQPYPVSDPPGTQRFWWDLNGVAPGAYYVSGVLSNGDHTTTWYSDTQVNVTN